MNPTFNFVLITLTWMCVSGIGLAASSQAGQARSLAATDAAAAIPRTLHETGLFVPGSVDQVDPSHIEFTPQYPLWSDGATKRRWLYLPPGTSIDAANPDVWEFPRGTRLWKEFAHGNRVETRFIERRADGSWRYASYIWNDQGEQALLAPSKQTTSLSVRGAPNGRYAVPSQDDCRACHEGAAAPVLGFSALQLSSARDALAPHGETAHSIDLRTLVARGLIRNLPARYLREPPAIAAATPIERAALGYLHGNCGHCHNDAGPLAPLELALSQLTSTPAASTQRTLSTLIDQPSEFRWQELDRRLVAGNARESVLAMRMRSRNPLHQMPPLGTEAIDLKAIALIERWIEQLPPHQEIKP